MEHRDAYCDTLGWARRAYPRYGSDPARLLRALATRCVTAQAPSAQRLATPAVIASIAERATGQPVSRPAATAALRSARRRLVTQSPVPMPAARRLVAGLLLDLTDSVPSGRRAQARRAYAIIGLQAIAEWSRYKGTVIVASTWLARQLGCTQPSAWRTIQDLEQAGLICNSKKLHDNRTTVYTLRPARTNADSVAAQVFAEDVGALAHGTATPAGSLTDVIRSAPSPAWLHPGSEIPHRGAWCTALREAAAAAVVEALSGYRAVEGPGNPMVRAASELRGRLVADRFGGASKNERRRVLDWFTSRPEDVGYVAWMRGLGESSGAHAAAEERETGERKVRRSWRAAGDAATGGRRGWREPEEVVLEVINRATGGAPLPTTPGEARQWAEQLAAVWPQMEQCATTSQVDAGRRAIRGAMVRAGLEPDRAAAVAERICGAVRPLGLAA